ncbi:unnamed protein product [Brugia timori]|uniref:G_PROTEIN_RECEP_F1_2 domain-containing protein n=1 Tax=Brugia timori TaxID=42155 RepID=A0A0R3R1S3_9BILA|nr:unnamed protein product [Brugia timori]
MRQREEEMRSTNGKKFVVFMLSVIFGNFFLNLNIFTYIYNSNTIYRH